MQAPHHHAHPHSHSHQHSHSQHSSHHHHHHTSSSTSSSINSGHSRDKERCNTTSSPTATSVSANHSDTSSLISAVNNHGTEEKLIEVDVLSNNDDHRAGACSALFIRYLYSIHRIYISIIYCVDRSINWRALMFKS